jgi:putative membrane protein
MISLLLRWVLNAGALLLVAYLLDGVTLETYTAAFIAALVLGLVNAVIRPVLVVLTLPVTILTLGLFIFVINALLFWLTAEIVKGFHVDGFGWALLGSILYSIITLVTSWLFFSKESREP